MNGTSERIAPKIDVEAPGIESGGRTRLAEGCRLFESCQPDVNERQVGQRGRVFADDLNTNQNAGAATP